MSGLGGLCLSRLRRLCLSRLARLCLSRLGGLSRRTGLRTLRTRAGLPLRGLFRSRAARLGGGCLPGLGWLCLPRLGRLRLSGLGCGRVLTRLAGLIGLGLARQCVLRWSGTLAVLIGYRLFSALRALAG